MIAHQKIKSVGGQAVIEGVMMRSPKNWTVAVRDQKGEIHHLKEELSDLPRFLKFPFVRGGVALIQALYLGVRAIEFSAGKVYEEDGGTTMSRISLVATMIVAFLLGIGLFILLPLYLTKLVGMTIPGVEQSSFLFNFVDGIIRVLIFLFYVFAIGRWKEMARIFMYHGAEHKVIHAYERGMELTLDNVRDYSPLHPRCGTSFLMIVMVVSILVFSFIPQQWVFIYKFLSRIVLIPLIAGASFELLKLSAKWDHHPVMHFLITPGLMLQRLTTREPDDSQLEVALSALIEVLKLEESNA